MKHGNVKYSEEMKAKWWVLYSKHGVTVENVAKRFDVKPATVRDHINKQRKVTGTTRHVIDHSLLPTEFSGARVQMLCHPCYGHEIGLDRY